MSNRERHLDEPAFWMRVVIADEHTRRPVAHLFPRNYYTAFCGYDVERAAAGFLFDRELAAPEDKRCATCRRVAAHSRFNVPDATP